MKKTFMTILLAAIALPALTQTLNSGYFLDGSYDKFKLNPALEPEATFFSLPVLGDIHFGLITNAGLSDFIFDSKRESGMKTTFMSGDVDSQTFLGNLEDVTRLDMNLDLSLLEVGFFAFQGFNTITAELHSDMGLYIPKSLFAFMKAGLSGGTYDINDLHLSNSEYLDIAIGHSHRIITGLTLGARLHFLPGLAYANVSADNLHAELGDNQWLIKSRATATTAINGTSPKFDENGNLDSFDFGFGGLSGKGYMFDLGANYDFKYGLTFSASVTGIGSMHWDHAVTIGSDPTAEVTFNGFDNIDDIDGQLESMTDDLKKMVEFKELNHDNLKTSFSPVIRAGVEYEVTDWLTVGELFSRQGGNNEWTEARTAFNLEPTRWFDMSASLAFTNLGTQMGWMVNFHPAGFNLYAGCDCFKATLNKDYLPVSSIQTNMIVGIRHSIGKNRRE